MGNIFQYYVYVSVQCFFFLERYILLSHKRCRHVRKVSLCIVVYLYTKQFEFFFREGARFMVGTNVNHYDAPVFFISV